MDRLARHHVTRAVSEDGEHVAPTGRGRLDLDTALDDEPGPEDGEVEGSLGLDAQHGPANRTENRALTEHSTTSAR